MGALDLQIPDQVPTFELEFQLTEELLGKSFYGNREFELPFDYENEREREKMIEKNAQLYVEIAEELEHSIIMITSGRGFDDVLDTVQAIKDISGDRYMIIVHGDGTFSIPDGEEMVEMAHWLYKEKEEAKAEARRMADEAIKRAERAVEAGVDGFALCADYCFNDGPFFSPNLFAEFIAPYLADIIDKIRELGAYAIKHTDGDIIPILDALVDCKPHALHSLDPMAGVDIKEVKEQVGDRVCLIGNVNCALMQTGTEEEIKESALYALENGKPGGGYIFSTSNVAFKGMPLESYLLIHEIWKDNRAY